MDRARRVEFLLPAGFAFTVLAAGCAPGTATTAGENAAAVAGTSGVGGVSNVIPTWQPEILNPNGGTNGSNGSNGTDDGGADDTDDPNAPAFTIEPDNFADGTDLTGLNPNVTLSTTGADNVPVELFFVSASEDNLDLAPTGTRVFGHANIPFFNNDRRLRMDFASPANYVSLLFAGGTFFETEIGRLQAYDQAGNLLAEYVTQPRESGETELMTIARPTADIAWALAYVAENEGSFGRLDQLGFTLGEPADEPDTARNAP